MNFEETHKETGVLRMSILSAENQSGFGPNFEIRKFQIQNKLLQREK
jgi:hypothetical protein